MFSPTLGTHPDCDLPPPYSAVELDHYDLTILDCYIGTYLDRYTALRARSCCHWASYSVSLGNAVWYGSGAEEVAQTCL